MIQRTSPILRAMRTACQSESAAVEFFELHRWPNGTACPRCGSVNVYQMKTAGGTRNKDYRWRCRDCAGKATMFTVRTGTSFEETRLPMKVWAFAFWRACASKKGVSALQLARECEISHKSALFVLRRIRHGMGAAPDSKKLAGTVEADELYVGGRPRRGTSKRGRGTTRVPVLGMVQRGGDVRFHLMDRLTSARLAEVLAENADLTCRLITDDYPAYWRVGKHFSEHEVVRHGIREYVRPGTDIHSNTIEGVFSLISRGLMGTFHSVTKKHLPNYLNEFSFRWNTRKLDDGERVSRAVRAMEGKRLEYRESVDNPPYIVNFPPKPEQQADAPF